MRDAEADKYMLSDTFKAGWDACQDLMLEDMKKLVEALEFYSNIERRSFREWIDKLEYDWGKKATQALQEYKSKWGEV